MTYIYTLLKMIAGFLLLAWPLVLFISVMMFPTSDASNNKEHVIMTVLILIYPIYISALFWIFDSSLFWMPGRALFISSVILVFLGMNLVGYNKMIFNIGRNLNSSGYTITETKVYLNGNLIEGADPKTFESLTANLNENISSYESPYTKDKDHVYYSGEIINEINPKTARVVDQEFKWWLQDEDSVFFQGNKIEGVDSNNYELRNNLYIITPDKVFFQDKEIVGADKESFEILRNRITKDKNKIYYENNQILEMADAKSFQMFPENDVRESFGFDKKGLYDPYQNTFYPDIDLDTFKGFERGYFSDKNAVYTRVPRGLKKIEGANPNSFMVTGWDEKTRSDAYDGSNLYINGELVK